jgi:hypothetical protein
MTDKGACANRHVYFVTAISCSQQIDPFDHSSTDLLQWWLFIKKAMAGLRFYIPSQVEWQRERTRTLQVEYFESVCSATFFASGAEDCTGSLLRRRALSPLIEEPK